MVEDALTTRGSYPIPGNGHSELSTVIAGTTDRERIGEAVSAWTHGLHNFVFPAYLDADPALAPLRDIEDVVHARFRKVEDRATAVIHEINGLIALRSESTRHKNLVARDQEQWATSPSEAAEFEYGVRGCIDQGIPFEAIVGPDGNFGRSLAGDDNLVYVSASHQFALAHSLIGKRLIHTGRTLRSKGLEPLVEHTDCGRRGQIIANLDANNKAAEVVETVFNNLDGLDGELGSEDDSITVQTMKDAWVRSNEGKKHMAQDGGRWIGIVSKIAQRAAYRRLPHIDLALPIELYDKRDSNLIVGLDKAECLVDQSVLEQGGYTDDTVETLSAQGHIFSLKHEFQHIASEFDMQTELGVEQGTRTIEDLQTSYVDCLEERLTITENLWRMYRDESTTYSAVRAFVDKYIQNAFATAQRDLDAIDANPRGVVTTDTVRRRAIHHVFQVLAYAWQQDTFSQGHALQDHLEDHLAIGESGDIGIKRHLPLGQGDLIPPDSEEIFTERGVLLHSKRVEADEPIAILLKSDTERDDASPMTSEETDKAMKNFEELLKLWPYVVIGDTVPLLVVRGKTHNRAVSRIALSVLEAFGDIVTLHAHEGTLPNWVPANNSTGQMVYVPAQHVLNLGIQHGEDLAGFRSATVALADQFSLDSIQVTIPK